MRVDAALTHVLPGTRADDRPWAGRPPGPDTGIRP